MKTVVAYVFLFIASCAYAQPPNIKVGAPLFSNMPWLGCATDGAGVQHLYIFARTPWPHSGAYISADGGQTWTGNATTPETSTNSNDPWGAMDASDSEAYACYGFDHVSHSGNWGASWSSAAALPHAPGDAVCTIVDNTNGSHSHPHRIYFIGDTLFYYSDDTGKTFTAGTLPGFLPSQGGKLPIITLDSSGTLYDFTMDTLYHDQGWNYYPIETAYSTTGGASWTAVGDPAVALSVTPIAANRQFMAATTLNGNLSCEAFQDVYWIRFGWTTDPQHNRWNGPITVDSDGVEPNLAIDSVGKIYVSYYKNTADSHYVMYLAMSRDTGKTWSKMQIGTTPTINMKFSDYGVGGWTGLAAMDTSSAGVAWADNRGGVDTQYNIYFARAGFGTQFANELDSNYAFHLTYHTQSDAVHTTTITSLGCALLQKDTNYVVHSDSLIHYDFTPTGRNYEYYAFSFGISGLQDTLFNHVFTASGLPPQLEIAHFPRLDTVTVKNDLEGGTDSTVLWAVSNAVGASPSTSVSSPFSLDTAYQSLSTRQQTKFYDFKAPDTIKALGTTWWRERWSTGSPTDTGATLSNVVVLKDTSLSMLYKGHMRSARNYLQYSNQRKIAMAGDTQQYWFCYESRGNIYLCESYYVAHPRGCAFMNETRLNNNYGHSINPSLCFTPKHGAGDTGYIYIVWEDSVGAGASTQRTIRYCRVNEQTEKLDTTNRYIWLASYGDSSFTSAHPAAPMVCAALPAKDGVTYYGRAVAVWSDADSLGIAVLAPNGCLSASAEHVPNSYEGEYPAIEPANGNVDTAGGRNDAEDFVLSWKKYVAGTQNSGLSTMYSYLDLNCGRCSSGGTIFCYTTPYDLSGEGFGGVPSIVATTIAEPLIAWSANGNINLFYGGSGSFHVGSIYTAMKPAHDSAWGGGLSVQVWTSPSSPVNLYAPSITSYADNLDSMSIFWNKQTLSAPDSIEHGTFSVASGSGVYATSSLVHTLSAANVRSPFLPFNRYTGKADDREIYAKDSANTHILHRASLAGTCDAPDNYAARGVHDYNQGIALLHDTSYRFISGEYRLLQPGAVAALHQQMLDMAKPINSIGDAANAMRSQNFTITSNRDSITAFSAVALDTAAALASLDTSVFSFVTELRDSATGNLLQTLGTVTVQKAAPQVSGALGTDTVVVTGDSGKTCYIRVTIDTVKTPASAFSFAASQILSENLISNVAGGGLGKEFHPRNIFAFLPAEQLKIYPNPTNDKSQFEYNIYRGGRVQIQVYDMLGRMVKQLADMYQPNGRYGLAFDTEGLPSGYYKINILVDGNLASVGDIVVKK